MHQLGMDRIEVKRMRQYVAEHRYPAMSKFLDDANLHKCDHRYPDVQCIHYTHVPISFCDSLVWAFGTCRADTLICTHSLTRGRSYT